MKGWLVSFGTSRAPRSPERTLSLRTFVFCFLHRMTNRPLSNTLKLRMPTETRTRTILFLDVVGWSKLSPAQIRRYVTEALPAISKYLDEAASSNTWGDAIVALFDSVRFAAAAALDIQAYFQRGSEDQGITEGLSCRIALHQGEVIVCHNPVLGREDFFGDAIHLAARLEPVTESGHIFCTETVARSLREIRGLGARAWPIGIRSLAKGYGSEAVYVITGGNVVSAPVLESAEPHSVAKSGIIKVFPSRQVTISNEYATRLASLHSHLDILGFGLRAFREDHFSSYAKWKEHANIRVLLLDPNSPSPDLSFSAQRDKEEHNAEGAIRTDVKTFLRVTAPLRDRRFQVRFYKCLPSINIFRIDDELFWGPYLIHEQSRNTPTILVGQGMLFERIMAHFDRIWNDGAFSFEAPLELEST